VAILFVAFLVPVRHYAGVVFPFLCQYYIETAQWIEIVFSTHASLDLFDIVLERNLVIPKKEYFFLRVLFFCDFFSKLWA